MEYKIKGHLICCINSINSKVLTLEIDVAMEQKITEDSEEEEEEDKPLMIKKWK
jgi:hypothetical protein